MLQELRKLRVYYQIKLIILGIKDLLPGIMKQLGPKQFSFIKEYAEHLKNNTKETKIDEAPELVENFEDVSNQQD